MLFGCAVVAIRGDSLVAVHRLPLAVASLVSEHGSRAWRLQWWWPTGLVALGHIGSSGPGIKPVSPALAGRFSTSGPTGKFLKFTS